MNRMKRFQPLTLSLLALGWALALAAAPAAAQSGDHERVREYMERTGELILWAKDLVAETESGPARRVLQSAVELHQRSMGAFENNRPLMALDVSRRARTAAFHAARLAREAMGLQERIQIRAERFADEHAQLTERARDAGHRQALDLLQQALQRADRAREHYRQGDFQVAWKMLEQAGDLLQRAARMVAEAGGPDRLDRELERTADLIARVRERLGAGAGPRAMDLLDQARDALERAFRARDQGRPGQALRMAGQARHLAHRAEGMDDRGPSLQDVQGQLDRFDARMERVSDAVRESGSEPARDFLRRATGQRERAAEALAAGEAQQALRLIRSGHDLLHQAEDVMRR